MTWKENLIRLYFYICEDKEIQNHIAGLRMSYNQTVAFTDEEVMTVYVFGILNGLSKVRQVYDHTRRYLRDWFPRLPSYQAFNNRLNHLAACFEVLVRSVNMAALLQEQGNERVIDSVPIIVTGKSRSSTARVASGLCSKGYCASKQLYYYGVKLHVTAVVRPCRMPLPQASWISAASESDLTAARPVLEQMRDGKVYADKIYQDKELNKTMQRTQNATLITPVKKGIHQLLVDAAADLLSAAVSKVRHPVESLFNWMIEKTQIPYAQRVRSENGLLVHIWGKFAAILFLMANIITLD